MSAPQVDLTQERHGVYYLTHLIEQGSIFQSQPQAALTGIGQRWADILSAWRWAAEQARVNLLSASTRGLMQNDHQGCAKLREVSRAGLASVVLTRLSRLDGGALTQAA